MSTTVDVVDGGLPAPAYIPGARGHVVLALGPDVDDLEALAVWSLDVTGRAVGAWVIPLDQGDRLVRVLASLRGRGVADWSAEVPAAIIQKIAHLLPPDLAERLRASVLAIPDLLTEVIEHRDRYHVQHEQARAATKSKLLPLEWTIRLTTPAPEPTRAALGVSRPWADSPVAGDALAVSAELRRAIELWQDTEQVRFRRAHLRSIGDVQPLPPRWLSALRAADEA